jgi:ribosome-associated heat shock protein Hsp15
MADTTRLDRWLWAARFFKTRALAAAAADGGKVQVNGNRAKPAKPLRVGDRVRVRKPPYEFQLVVRGLSQRRGPPPEAARLYDEEAESRQARELLALRLKLEPTITYEGKGRPTKKARRDIERLKGD